MTFGIMPVLATDNQKGQTHDRQQQGQHSFANLLAHNVHDASQLHALRNKPDSEHHNSDIVQLHMNLDLSLKNLPRQIMRVNLELSRSLEANK